MNNRSLSQPPKINKAYFSVKETAEYTGMGVRTIRGFLNDPITPLPHYRVGSAGRIIKIHKDELDSWLKTFRVDSESMDIDEIVNEFI